MRISDWSSDVCSSDLTHRWIDLCALFIFDVGRAPLTFGLTGRRRNRTGVADILRVLPVGFILIALFAKVACLTGLELFQIGPFLCLLLFVVRSAEHTSELQSLMRITYAGSRLKTTNSKK